MTAHITVETPDVRLRREWAEAFCYMLLKVEPDIAAELCAAHLDNIATGMPGFDPWADLRADAAFWADCTSPAELNLYALAALRRLGGRIQGRTLRKRLMVGIWNTLPAADQAAFVARVTGGAGR